jgi:hypothetical protein
VSEPTEAEAAGVARDLALAVKAEAVIAEGLAELGEDDAFASAMTVCVMIIARGLVRHGGQPFHNQIAAGMLARQLVELTNARDAKTALFPEGLTNGR